MKYDEQPRTLAMFPITTIAHCALCGEPMPDASWDICEACIDRADQLPRTPEGHRHA